MRKEASPSSSRRYSPRASGLRSRSPRQPSRSPRPHSGSPRIRSRSPPSQRRSSPADSQATWTYYPPPPGTTLVGGTPTIPASRIQRTGPPARQTTNRQPSPDFASLKLGSAQEQSLWKNRHQQDILKAKARNFSCFPDQLVGLEKECASLKTRLEKFEGQLAKEEQLHQNSREECLKAQAQVQIRIGQLDACLRKLGPLESRHAELTATLPLLHQELSDLSLRLPPLQHRKAELISSVEGLRTSAQKLQEEEDKYQAGVNQRSDNALGLDFELQEAILRKDRTEREVRPDLGYNPRTAQLVYACDSVHESNPHHLFVDRRELSKFQGIVEAQSSTETRKLLLDKPAAARHIQAAITQTLYEKGKRALEAHRKQAIQDSVPLPDQVRVLESLQALDPVLPEAHPHFGDIPEWERNPGIAGIFRSEVGTQGAGFGDPKAVEFLEQTLDKTFGRDRKARRAFNRSVFKKFILPHTLEASRTH